MPGGGQGTQGDWGVTRPPEGPRELAVDTEGCGDVRSHGVNHTGGGQPEKPAFPYHNLYAST